MKHKEIIRIAKLAGWEIDLKSKTVKLSDEFYDLIQLQYNDELSLDAFINFFEQEHKSLVRDAILKRDFDLINNDIDVLLKTTDGSLIWVKLIMTYESTGKGKHGIVKGVIQNIDKNKRKENELKASLDLFSYRNKRLQNFAYIVSHNLRSHAGNLQLMISLYEETNRAEE